MEWTDRHTASLSIAFENVLGKPEGGTIAFVRCLAPDVVEALSKDSGFSPKGWIVWRVADDNDLDSRTIAADRAVEIREAKSAPALLLVDTTRASAGMDGIYSAVQEVREGPLLAEAIRASAREITWTFSKEHRQYAEKAVKKARGYGNRYSVSLWAEFDYLTRVANGGDHPGALLYLLGLWPVQGTDCLEGDNELDLSRRMVERLLGPNVSGHLPARRIDSLRLSEPTGQQVADLERFLRDSATKPLLAALAELSKFPHLYVGSLKLEESSQEIQSIELVSWRTSAGKISKWSGLVEEGGEYDPPALILKDNAKDSGDYSTLEIRWRTRPEALEKGAVDYRVAILTDMEEEIADREVVHSGKRDQKCRFSNDDFDGLSEDARISAKAVVSVLGDDSIDPQETEEFSIRFGEPLQPDRGGVGKKVRALSEGLIELDARESVTHCAEADIPVQLDSKGYCLFRTLHKGKSYRVFQPPLIREVEAQWKEQEGWIGRWCVRVRTSGARAGYARYVPIERRPEFPENLWLRAENASRRFCERLAVSGGGVAQVYDDKSRTFDAIVKEYLLSWTAVLEQGVPELALANTVEVQSLSGRTIGVVVLPSHPLRVAWHVAFDNLALHARFNQEQLAKDVRDELEGLDGAMFPAFLPGLEQSNTLVFADTLGFHAVGMVPDTDKEPKAALAILARALGESETADTSPTVGIQSAQVLGTEIAKYLECHNTPRLLHVHALRPGDGMTVARSFGSVLERFRKAPVSNEADEDGDEDSPAFVLEMYPSHEQRGVAGRFISEAREKRRSGAGVLADEDRWMLESLPLQGGINLPRLRWARKRDTDPQFAAHLAVAFDTFEPKVILDEAVLEPGSRPFYAFGLMSFFERRYSSRPSPNWISSIPCPAEGEKHPSDRMHTERLTKLQQAVHVCVTRNLGGNKGVPLLRTEISPEKADSLLNLHRLCDWVITLDRNAGIEYFDSPNDSPEIYDAYVIDCVPEREDLGCLQLVTSTSNLEEVRNLLDHALNEMGLSQSRRNAQFLMGHLKALSGRLAICLTGQKAAQTAELVAMALCHANSREAHLESDCWTPLGNGFFVPVDDVRDLLPPLAPDQGDAPEEEGMRNQSRPDLIHVSLLPKKGLAFRFIEVKYRRHLRSARNPEELHRIRRQVESLRRRWDDWYSHDDVCSAFRAVRRAKLARVLRFYADKARRHYLSKETHETLVGEIDKMVEKGGDYPLHSLSKGDRGWVFCPEYAGINPTEISPREWETRIFLFGPGLLPDSDFRRDSIAVPAERPLEAPKGFAQAEQKADTIPIEPPASVATDSSQPPNPRGEEPDEPQPAVAGEEPEINFGKDTFTGNDVKWPLTVKGNPHLLVAGLPGMGKTTCLLNLCKQMLAAGVRPIVFSYHQDIDKGLEQLVGAVRFIDFSGLGFNPLHITNRESRTAYLDVAGALRDIFAAIFPEIGDIQSERIRKAVKESFVEAGWDAPRVALEGLEEPSFSRFVEILRQDPKPDRGLKSLLARLEELEDYGFFELGEPQGSLWDCEHPIVIRIHATQNDNLQKAFASLIFYGLYKDMFRRGIKDRVTHAVVFDEAHRAAGLKLIPKMAKECRKYGISLVLASQEAKDFNASLFSAIANYLVLRLTETDAKALVRNVASSQQERMLMDKIKQMERFKALYFCETKTRPVSVALSP